ncbi:MAG TPA: DUF1254 domain-containing protein [Solirubrobacterales bacterium]|nr:DUF1254 domain-containing protein [Solirubrobacterales bacterium]
MQLMTLTETQAQRLGADAFVFGFPLLLMTATMRQATGVEPVANGEGFNRFAHLRHFVDPAAKTIVAANVDTLYSLTWLDLSDEPALLKLPDTGGRSYLMPLLDAWTNVFASLDPHTIGSDGGTLAITGPDWTGEIPAGARRIEAPTNNAWGIFHLHAHNRQDLDASRAIQGQLELEPMSAQGSTVPAPLPEGRGDSALDPLPPAHRRVMEMDASQFLAELAAQMRINPPAAIDLPMLERLAAIELLPGCPFDWSALSEATRESLAIGLEEGKELVSMPSAPEAGRGWQVLHTGAGSYGTDYLRRAHIANFALGINRPEDAIFPLNTTDEDGNQLTGSNRYLLRFEHGAIPPVDGIWSLGVYDMDQLFVSNPIDRYALGSRDELELASDGSLEIVIQHQPTDRCHPNWLPAPEGDFYLMLHLYKPSESILEGTWAAPPIQRIA